MRIVLLSALVICITATGATAVDNSQAFRSFLSGTSCSQLINGLKNKETRKEFILMTGAFITGSNYAKGRDSKIDLRGMMLLTEQYCRQNPELPVTSALAFLDNAIDRRNAFEAQNLKNK